MSPHGQQTDELVLAERRGAVLVLTLNRPERLNAWTNDLEDRYFALLDEAEDDASVRAIVVTGAGRGFCAGADLANLSNIEGAPARARRPRPRSYPLGVDKPLIAAINGAAAGLGLVEALFCDVRFCVPEAKLTTAFTRRGLIAEYGIAHLLVRLVGSAKATDLLLSGRVIRGEEACAIGLVDRLVDPADLLAAAVAYAEDLARSCSPRSMAIVKRQLRVEHLESFERSYTLAEGLMLSSFAAPDVKEGVASHRERRTPQFPPLPRRDARGALHPSSPEQAK